jgi:arsenite-transporting ATPase
MRIIIFSGLGGSGVSTVAAATASAIAESGQRTIAFAITKGIGRALGVDGGLEATAAAPDLEVIEGHGGHGGPDEFRDWIEMLLRWRNMDPDLAEDLAALPGINHIGRLLELEHLVRSDAYDVAVIDAAELSQFLDLPGALDGASRWLDRLFAPRQQTIFEPFARMFAGDYVASADEVLEIGRDLLTRLANLRDLFGEPETTSVRVVVGTSPAALPAVKEALSVLTLFEYRIEATVLNKLLPDDVADPFFAAARKSQDELRAEIAAIADGPPLLELALRREPPMGGETLRKLAKEIYGKRDPADFITEAREHMIDKEEDGYILSVLVPFAAKNELRLEEVEDGIAVHLNGRRCVILLPDELLETEATSWTYEAGILRVVLSE